MKFKNEVHAVISDVDYSSDLILELFFYNEFFTKIELFSI